MAVHQLLVAPGIAGIPEGELDKRSRRWRFFRVVFALTYMGIVLDIITTAIGYQKSGAGYEQNPLGGLLIGNLGWMGMFVMLTALCALCYVSVRLVYWRMSTAWSAFINALFVLMMLFRWLAVVTAIIYILQPTP